MLVGRSLRKTAAFADPFWVALAIGGRRRRASLAQVDADMSETKAPIHRSLAAAIVGLESRGVRGWPPLSALELDSSW